MFDTYLVRNEMIVIKQNKSLSCIKGNQACFVTRQTRADLTKYIQYVLSSILDPKLATEEAY